MQETRHAMRRLAASVVIVTGRDDAGRYAMAATSVTSLSMEPPSLLLCVNRSASIYAPLAAGADFCVNILAWGHQALSVACSGAEKGEARFAIGDWREDSDSGMPYLGDAQAGLICRSDAIHHYGTHGIFIGQILRVHAHGEIDPLIYLDGRYIRFFKDAPGVGTVAA